MMRYILLSLLMLFVPPCLGGESVRATKPVQVSVTSVSGQSVYLDHGRASGITPGLRVRLFLSGGTVLDADILDATSNNARIELPEGTDLPTVGTLGQVEVPDAAEEPAPTPEPKPEPDKPVPEHPPWTRQEGQRSPDMPLLAPAFARPAKERPPAIRGRVYGQMEFNRSEAGGQSSDFMLGRVGTWLEVTNPFRQGGRLQFAGQFSHRGESLFDTGDSSRNDFIVDRFSYAFGGEQYAGYRAEVGRFISIYLPELGLVDGAEAALLYENGLAVGGALAMYPRPYPDRDWGDDYGMHAFVSYQSKAEHRFSGTLGYQKTWHDDSPDRDVLLGRFNMAPSKKLWVSGSFKSDVYTPGDPIKSTGPSLTEAWAMVRYMPTNTTGVSLSGSHYSYPDTRQREFASLPPDLIADGRVDRLDLSGWKNLMPSLRWGARGNYWNDQDGDGFGGSTDLDWDRIGGGPVGARVEAFYAQAAFNEGMGFRLGARAYRGDVSGTLDYEYYSYRSTGQIITEDFQTRHTIRAGATWQAGKMFYNVHLDHSFGDGQKSYSAGVYVEYRF